MLSKLNTKQDPQYFHKILGFASVCHFFIHIYGCTLQSRALRILAINCHLLLGISSFLFKVPLKRVNLFVIFKELQLHNILFTLRSVVVYCLIEFSIYNTTLRLVSILATSMLADYISIIYNNNRETLVRTFGRHKHPIIRHFMSYTQFVGTYTTLVAVTQRPIIMTIMVIQIGAFTGTLVRKGLIRKGGIPYGLAIVTGVYCSHLTLYEHMFVSFLYVLRCNNINKYLLWIVAHTLYNWHQSGILY